MQNIILTPVPVPELVNLIAEELEKRIRRPEYIEPPKDRIDKEIVKQMTSKGDSWIYKKTMPKCKDPLPHEKFGKRLVFSRKKIQEYIDSHTIPVCSPEEIVTRYLQKEATKRLK